MSILRFPIITEYIIIKYIDVKENYTPIKYEFDAELNPKNNKINI
jgi:hypothetical protein